MNKDFSADLKDELRRFMQSLGACGVNIADARSGFDHAIDGCRPRHAMPDCSSVIVFGIYVGSDYYHSVRIETETTADHRILHLFRDWLQCRLGDYLQEKGFKTMTPRGFRNREDLTASLSYKLAAYESGLGVYGKCGTIITPEYGPTVNLGVVLTDVPLEPDPKLMDFNPCEGCRVCADLCPAKAIREYARPPEGHDRDRCVNFILRLREKTGDKNFLCGYCYDNCPVGKPTKRGFTMSRHRTLVDLEPHERELLIRETISSEL